MTTITQNRARFSAPRDEDCTDHQSHRPRRLVLPLPLATWLQAALAGSEISCVPLTGLIAASAANLADLHRDPADRSIISTALSTQRRLLTPDSTILSYPELADLLA